MLHVSIKAEEIFNFLGFPVTNSLLASSLVVILFFLIGLYFSKNSNSNSKPVFFIRFIIAKLYETFEPILGDLTPRVFPFIASIFLFVLMANWLGLLPGFGSITYKKAESTVVKHVDEVTEAHADTVKTTEVEHHEAPTPLLRGATADLNMTIALAVLAFLAIQYYGFKELGLSYIGKFITFKGPIDFFSGILELISEFSKIISFAFRLFGNVYAGEVLLAVIAFLIPVLASFPFLLLEVFVGFIQAIVFFKKKAPPTGKLSAVF
jgi:F-type H+-transporting ATPase subunit a